MFKVQLFVDGSKRCDLDGEYPTLTKAIGAAETAAKEPDARIITSYRIAGDGGVTELETQVVGAQRRFVTKNVLKPVS